MEWLTENKIPVGKAAASVFDWLQINGAVFFDALSDMLEAMIDAILWVLQTPNPFVIILLFVGITYGLQRSYRDEDKIETGCAHAVAQHNLTCSECFIGWRYGL